MRLIIRQEYRKAAENAAMEAAQRVNGGREVNLATEHLIKEAVEAAINYLEFKLA